MIHPNMATMLAFLTTDAAISQELLHKALLACVKKSFNMISVDGDTSTNDMALIMAMQTLRLFSILLTGPAVARFISVHAPKRPA